MIEIGKSKIVIVRMRLPNVNGKPRFVVKTDPDGKPETKIMSAEVTRLTKKTLGGNFGSDRARKLVVKLKDGDVLELRPQGTCQRYSATLADIYAWMIRSHSNRCHLEAARARKKKIAERREQRRRDAAERRLHQKLRTEMNEN